MKASWIKLFIKFMHLTFKDFYCSLLNEMWINGCGAWKDLSNANFDSLLPRISCYFFSKLIAMYLTLCASILT